MIRIERYESSVEERYWECVSRKLDETEQQGIVESSRRYMPPDFYSRDDGFKELILAPYEKLKTAYDYIERNMETMKKECFRVYKGGKMKKKALYEKLHNSYGKVFMEVTDGVKMNVFLVRQTGLAVCPYCGRDYINCRSETIAGAQMDHFYPRSKYPIFSLCLYNLVPVCGNCNRIKNDKVDRFASPFDETINWDDAVKFSYALLGVNEKRIVIKADETAGCNIEALQIEEAYQIHDVEVNELLDKVNMYSEVQLCEFKKVLGDKLVTEWELRKMVFGPEITEESMKKKPLGRMLRDLERELGIY